MEFFQGLRLLLASVPLVFASETTFPVSLGVDNIPLVPFTAAFNNAGVNTNISWGAGNSKTQPGPNIQALGQLTTTPFDFTSKNGWLAIAWDYFDLNFDIQIGLLPSKNQTQTFAYPIGVSQDLGEIQIPTEVPDEFITFYLTAAFELYAQLTSLHQTSFDTGFNVKLLQPAGILLSLDIDFTPLAIRPTESLTPFHFNVTPIFNTSDPSPEFSFEISVRSMFSIDIEFIKPPRVTAATLNIDMPAYNINATQKRNVDYLCKDATASLAEDETYANLTSLTEQVTMDMNWQLGTLLGGYNDTEPLLAPQVLYPLDQRCVGFSPSANHLVKAPKTVSQLETITSYNGTAGLSDKKHLSNGGAVGVTLAVEILIALIAAGLFWLFSTRRSRREEWEEDERPRHGFNKGSFVGLFKSGGARWNDHSHEGSQHRVLKGAAIAAFFATAALSIKRLFTSRRRNFGQEYEPPGMIAEKLGPAITNTPVAAYDSGEPPRDAQEQYVAAQYQSSPPPQQHNTTFHNYPGDSRPWEEPISAATPGLGGQYGDASYQSTPLDTIHHQPNTAYNPYSGNTGLHENQTSDRAGSAATYGSPGKNYDSWSPGGSHRQEAPRMVSAESRFNGDNSVPWEEPRVLPVAGRKSLPG